VRVEGIRKSFDGGAALHGVDLAVRPGELLALLGPSGSGKTTLLRVIAGLEIADEGRVFFGGEDVTDRPVQERRVGFVFQHYALFRHLTVFDNIAYGLRARGRAKPPASVIRQRVGDLLDLVQLSGLEARYPTQLSGGQRQRVALARALAVEPRVLLLDEPFGALDARVRRELRRWLKEIHRETGQTTIFVTHDQDEALEMADRLAILNNGLVEQVASPDDVYDRPASAFVMSFVGESNRLPVQVSGGTVQLADILLPIGTPATTGGEADLYLRPSDISLAETGAGVLTGRVVGLRRVGALHKAAVLLDAAPIEVEIDLRGPAPSRDEKVGLTLWAGTVFTRG
jgi:sulfate transport system ATP-binding protein